MAMSRALRTLACLLVLLSLGPACLADSAQPGNANGTQIL